MDVKYFYLNNKMVRAEYIRTQILRIPQEFVDKYNLKEKVHNGYIFSRLTKEMHGPPKAEQITHNALVKHTWNIIDTSDDMGSKQVRT